MTEKAESTHQRILGRGLEVVSERGLAGVSLVPRRGPGGLRTGTRRDGPLSRQEWSVREAEELAPRLGCRHPAPLADLVRRSARRPAPAIRPNITRQHERTSAP